MSRSYTQLECGCLISCDGGGGLMPSCGRYNEKEGIWIEDKNCKVSEYQKEHSEWYGGYCRTCHPCEYQKAKEYYREEVKILLKIKDRIITKDNDGIYFETAVGSVNAHWRDFKGEGLDGSIENHIELSKQRFWSQIRQGIAFIIKGHF